MKYKQDYTHYFIAKMNVLPHWAYDKSPDLRAEGLRNAWGEFGIDFTMKFEAYLEKLYEFHKDFKLDMNEVRKKVREKLDA